MTLAQQLDALRQSAKGRRLTVFGDLGASIVLHCSSTALAAKGACPSAARMPAPKPECLFLPVSPQRRIIVVSVCGERLLLSLRADAADAVLGVWADLFPGS
ncbi:hypothetical protein [Leisingera methylohalidivorans]|uniref:Uncharacterized protein n=1 Tax=Leisingera methylohalidivorans DSM 14336 TaxID=999552 RepID=V9VZ04_9RHOB|nr:hypothetical protein [Leisingera methylohalidivorans]AHD03173.1 hypothetical protein METH_15615 [Leisingera methylohalidivorans DSM 14336]